MSGFLDRLAARAVGDLPLVHPRVRARFEPDAGMLPSGPVEPAQELAEGGEVAPVPRVEVERAAQVERTFEPEPRRRPAEPDVIQPAVARPSASDPLSIPVPAESLPSGEGATSPSRLERLPVSTPLETEERREGSRLRRDPRPLPGEGEPDRTDRADAVSFRVVAPPLPGDGSAGGREGRGGRVHEPLRSEKPLPAIKRRLMVSPEPAEPAPLLRPRSSLAAELPTVEPDRHAPLLPSLDESEPSETVVHISIDRIDVRAAQPPAPERRPARPAVPRLSLENYLKRREERR